MSRSGVFLISESPLLWKFFEGPRDRPGRLEIDILVKNEDGREHVVKPSLAALQVNSARQALPCRDLAGSGADLRMAPGTMVRLRCEVDIKPTSENQLALRDTVVRLEIPTDMTPIMMERLFRIQHI